jgi:hypothetical protein
MLVPTVTPATYRPATQHGLQGIPTDSSAALFKTLLHPSASSVASVATSAVHPSAGRRDPRVGGRRGASGRGHRRCCHTGPLHCLFRSGCADPKPIKEFLASKKPKVRYSHRTPWLSDRKRTIPTGRPPLVDEF